ncbi:GLPGLI family protein [Arenibacter nanhaiticus]|uniref:GLPGLI family protein n=1 Tax=Arenibacter nanhaiticus TaxID=558155 RepID=A0A1M6HHR1_9FLAO|nr:GLPGLI family protein [Arenibacter nanhaiticus]SHJ21776.1 GLPGLI family protein [Arenibacter nanhaiticus]
MIRFLFLVVALMLSPIRSYSQDFQGEVTYFSRTAVDLDLSDREMPEERKKQIMQRVKEANERSYVLTFDRNASIYKEETTNRPGNTRGRTRLGIRGNSGGDYYKNILAENYTQQKDLMGKAFIVEDTLEKLDWKLVNETKKIGNYTVSKAIATKIVKRPNRRFFRRGSDNEAETEQSLFTEKEIEVEAWYTLEIPINQGPGEYWGLPGLILEINDDTTNLQCIKLVLNPKEKKEIVAPDKGKKMSKDQYEKIYQKKMEEMRQNFRGRNGNGGGRRL